MAMFWINDKCADKMD